MERIGSYINPVTGEEDWIEPETLQNILLIPKRVTKVGDNFETPIEFKIIYNKPDNKVGIYAEYTTNNRSYRSSIEYFDTQLFADEIASIVYANKTLDESTLVKETKEKLMGMLSAQLFNENIILSNFSTTGLGYVCIENKKAIVFDEIEFSYVNSREMHLIIKKAVGAVALANLSDPKIVFNTGNHEISFVFDSVVSANEGRIREYNVLIKDILVKAKTQIINTKQIKDEDDFIENRMKLLDSFSQSSDDFDDDRFEDIL